MIDFLIFPAFAGEATTSQSSSFSILDFAFPIIIFVLLYLIILRPQSKRAKEHRAMQAALLRGDEVVTDGGIMGKIINVTDNAITLEIADKIEVKLRRESVNSVMPKGTLKKL